MLLQQCLARKIPLSNQDQELLKRKVEYCVDSYKPFKSVDFAGLQELLQKDCYKSLRLPSSANKSPLLFWCHNASGYPVMSETVR
jgi:hypothetical protein